MHLRERRAVNSKIIERRRTRTPAAVVAIAATFLWVTAAIAAETGNAAKGKETFAKTCGTCHGNTGKGDGPAGAALNPKPKDLTDKAYVSKLDNTYLTNIIGKGGAAVGKSPLMPSFNGQLKDQDIKDVIAYIRSLAK
jgi:mono/diheme cytochrome c family protein